MDSLIVMNPITIAAKNDPLRGFDYEPAVADKDLCLKVVSDVIEGYIHHSGCVGRSESCTRGRNSRDEALVYPTSSQRCNEEKLHNFFVYCGSTWLRGEAVDLGCTRTLVGEVFDNVEPEIHAEVEDSNMKRSRVRIRRPLTW
jgi:hypothetical protein